MDSSVQFAECLVKKEYSGKELGAIKGKAALIIAASVAVTLAVCAFLPLLLPLLAVDAVIAWLAIRSMRAKLNTEFEYRVADGEMSVDRIVMRSRRKAVISFDLSHCETVAPYRGKYKDSADRDEYDGIIDVSASLSSPGTYFAVICQNSGDENVKTIVFFTPSEKLLRAIRFRFRRAVIEADDI